MNKTQMPKCIQCGSLKKLNLYFYQPKHWFSPLGIEISGIKAFYCEKCAKHYLTAGTKPVPQNNSTGHSLK